MDDVGGRPVKIERFEDFIVWQRARQLTRGVYHASSKGPFARDFGLRDQLRRAAVSVMANIAEGFERGGRREFHQFLSISKASCAELRSGLYVALDAEYISQTEFTKLLGWAEEVARMLGRMRGTVARQR